MNSDDEAPFYTGTWGAIRKVNPWSYLHMLVGSPSSVQMEYSPVFLGPDKENPHDMWTSMWTYNWNLQEVGQVFSPFWGFGRGAQVTASMGIDKEEREIVLEHSLLNQCVCVCVCLQ